MRITTELVEQLSQRSRLQLPQEEQEPMTRELERIVAYMDTLNALDTQGVEPLSHVFPVQNVLREDEVQPCMERTQLLQNAPASDQETFLVPRAVE